MSAKAVGCGLHELNQRRGSERFRSVVPRAVCSQHPADIAFLDRLEWQRNRQSIPPPIFAFNGTAILGPSLFSLSLGSMFSGGFSITPNLNLTAGGLYLVLATLPVDVLVRGITLSGNVYTGVESVDCSSATSCRPIMGDQPDVSGFAVTFAAATTAIPEPGTWALSAGGLLMVGFAARRRKHDT